MSELLQSIRSKYPAYKNTDDDTLVFGIGTKYPQYLAADAQFADEFENARVKRMQQMPSESMTPLLSTSISEQPEAPDMRAVARAALPEEAYSEQRAQEGFAPIMQHSGILDSYVSPVGLPRFKSSKDAGEFEKAGVGLANGVITLAEFFTSPLGVTTLGMGALPEAGQKAVALAFAGQMVTSMPGQAKRLYDSAAAGDTEKSVQYFTELFGTGVFARQSFKKGVEPDWLPEVRAFAKELEIAPPEQANFLVDRAVRNLMAPGTFRETELQVPSGPQAERNLPAEAVQMPSEVFERVKPNVFDVRFEDPKSLEPGEILSKVESETRGKVSFGAEAPTLAGQPLPERTRLALERERQADTAKALAPETTKAVAETTEGSPNAIQEPSTVPVPETPRAQGVGGVESEVRGAQEGAPAAKAEGEVGRSPQALGITNPQAAEVANVLRVNYSKWLTSPRGLPEVTFQEWVINRQGFIREQMNKASHALRDFYKAVKDEFGIGPIKSLFTGLKSVGWQQARAMDMYLKGQMPGYLIPEKLQEPLQKLRDHMDDLSLTMTQEGLVAGPLALGILDNFGIYMRRSFKVFDDPKWGLDKMDEQTRNRVINGMLGELKRDNPNATTEDAVAHIKAALSEYKSAGPEATFFSKGATLGSKDLSLFIKRKDLSNWWKEMMGEYRSPGVNYEKTIAKQARYIADERFVRAVEQHGRGNFLFKDPTGPFTEKIAVEGSQSLSPLNEYHTTKEIADAFKTFNQLSHNTAGWWQGFMAATYLARASKTVYSAMTQLRNAGQYWFWLSNGHVQAFMPGNLWKAISGVYADVTNTPGKWLDYYQSAIRHGIANESAQVGELRHILKDVATMEDAPGAADPFAGASGLRMAKRVFIDAPARGYNVADEIGKMPGWEVEKWWMRKIHPDWDENQVAFEAAKRVRNLYPTASMAPAGVKQFSKQPFLGNFPTFTAEAIRSRYNLIHYMMEDFTSGNPWQRARGGMYLGGALFTAAAIYGLQSYAKQRLGIGDNEEKNVRRMLPPWEQNSILFFTEPVKEGKTEYINLSYLYPFSYVTDPLFVALRPGDATTDDVFWRATQEAFRPFTDEGMVFKAFVDWMRNKTSLGGRVYNPEESLGPKAAAVAGHLLEPFEPGTIQRFRKQGLPAFKGEVKPYGATPTPEQYLTSEFTGFKIQTRDFRQFLDFQTKNFVEGEKAIEGIWRGPAARAGTVTEQTMVDEYKRMEGIRRTRWETLAGDIEAVRKSGVDSEEIMRILGAAGLDKQTARDLLNSRYRPYRPSKELKKRAAEQGHPIPTEQIGQLIRDSETTLKPR